MLYRMICSVAVVIVVVVVVVVVVVAAAALFTVNRSSISDLMNERTN